MSALEAALGHCDFIEFDVGFSKDAVAIIIHNYSCERTSNIKDFKEFKNRVNVYDLTYKELLQLDFDSWFIKKDPFGVIQNKIVNKNEISKQKILTLKEVLQFFKKIFLPMNIEIKDLSKTQFHKTVVRDIIEVILSEKVEDFVLLSSFNHEYLKEAKKIAPFIQRAALQENEHPKDLINYFKKLDIVAYHSDNNIINADIIKSLKEEHIYINVCTVNSQKRKDELYNLGVNAIFSDFL